MQVLLEEALDLEKVADLVGGPIVRDSQGWHVTDLIKAANRIAKGAKEPDYSQLEGLAAMGRIWERVAHDTVRSWVEGIGGVFLAAPRPAPILDGITGTLDGIAATPEWTAVVEDKLKFGRVANPCEETRWMMQVKAYCKLIYVRRALFPVLAILHSPPRAIAKLHLIEFSQEEIDENWAMLLNTKRYLERDERLY